MTSQTSRTQGLLLRYTRLQALSVYWAICAVSTLSVLRAERFEDNLDNRNQRGGLLLGAALHLNAQRSLGGAFMAHLGCENVPRVDLEQTDQGKSVPIFGFPL